MAASYMYYWYDLIIYKIWGQSRDNLLISNISYGNGKCTIAHDTYAGLPGHNLAHKSEPQTTKSNKALCGTQISHFFQNTSSPWSSFDFYNPTNLPIVGFIMTKGQSEQVFLKTSIVFICLLSLWDYGRD